MTTARDVFAPGTPCWVDLSSSNTEGAREFYGALLGWTFDEPNPDFGGYANARAGGTEVAGLMTNLAPDRADDGWTSYFATADIAASVAAATGAGGTVVAAPARIGELGTMAVLVDPSGAAFGFWEGDRFPGFAKLGEQGSAVWTEYHAERFAEAVRFYRDALGWTIEPMADTDEFRYSTAQVAGVTLAGMLDAAVPPSQWMTYFAVPDVDAALQRVLPLGGSVLRPAQDSPHGRVAEIADPTGARCKLVDPSRTGG